MIFHFLQDPIKRGWAFVAIVTLLVLALAGPLVWMTDGRHLSAYGDHDEDASLARKALDGRAATIDNFLSTPHLLSDIREPALTLLVILGNERRYTQGETAVVLDYLTRGGNVILADEGGYGSDIAREAGFAFREESLVDSRHHGGDATLVTSTTRLDGRDFRLLFNAPTAITPIRDDVVYEVLAESSIAEYPGGSYLDVNRNGKIDRSDLAAGSGEGFPLIIRTTYGAGGLLLVADTGLFMNGQVRITDYDNDDFIAAMAASMLGRSDGRILIDEARHAPTVGVAFYDNAVRTLGLLTSGLIAPLVTLGVILLLSAGAWRFTRETEDWSHHDHDLGHEVRVPEDLRPDLDRAQRMARRRISERFNIPLEQVAAMTAEELVRLSGDRVLSEAAAGTLRSDPAPLFQTFSTEASS